MIRSKFFVDNLATSSNSVNKLTHLYKTCTECKDKAHFYLRPCNSNSKELQQLMIEDSRFVTHDSLYDKVLG